MVRLFLSVVPMLLGSVPRFRMAMSMLTMLLVVAGTGSYAYGQQQDALENRIKPADIHVRLGKLGPKFTYADVVIENKSRYTVASMMVSVYLDRSIPCTGFWVESQDIDCAQPAVVLHSLHFDSKNDGRGGIGPHESITYRIWLDEWAKEKDTVGIQLRPTVNWVRPDATKQP